LDLVSGPKDIKLFTNKPSIGFEDVEDDEEAAQILSLTEDDLKDGKKIPLKFVRFQSVNSLHVRDNIHLTSHINRYVDRGLYVQVFVASNQGDEEETRINSLNIFGVPVQLRFHLCSDGQFVPADLI
jgi:PITH domain